jgi:hypothetical protein
LQNLQFSGADAEKILVFDPPLCPTDKIEMAPLGDWATSKWGLENFSQWLWTPVKQAQMHPHRAT